MTVYVAEISGRGIAAFNAASEAEAAVHLADKAFVRDLIVFRSQGRPLWDGVAKIQMRRASPEEAAAWQSGMVVGDEDRFVFLVPVVDPSDDKFDDDDDHDMTMTECRAATCCFDEVTSTSLSGAAGLVDHRQLS